MDQLTTGFIQFTLDRGVLRFGDFTLKSGRKSPYFFNLGLFQTGDDLTRLGEYYARKILSLDISYNMVFGPAYKGIPLVSATAIALAQLGHNVPYAFNRKETKDHGEGGMWVGAPLAGKVILLDDVISAGTTAHEIIPLIRAAGAEVTAIMLALNREERGKGNLSAVAEIEQMYHLPVYSLISLSDLIKFFNDQGKSSASVLSDLTAYRAQYGA
jgi:orotate phosphoribosyltransferase